MSITRLARKSGLISFFPCLESQSQMKISELLWGSADVKMLPFPPSPTLIPSSSVLPVTIETDEDRLALETWMETICGRGIK